MRTHIIGTSGSGKTVLAEKLAQKLQCPHIELDALYWRDQWTHITDSELQLVIKQPLLQEQWVIDGEYMQINNAIWPKTDLIIWLDYSLPVVLNRLMCRGIKYVRTEHDLWGTGNQETLGGLFGRRSILWKALRSHNKRRRIYLKLMKYHQLAHGKFQRFTSPQATGSWLQTL